MKRTAISILFSILIVSAFSQKKETFDLVTYSAPKNWKKEQHQNGLQLSNGDEKKGNYSVIIIFKSTESTGSAKENFDMAWEKMVKGTVTVSTAPEMLQPASEEGWEILTGMAPFTDGNNKGVVLQISATGYDKNPIIIIMTNTDAYQTAIDEFTASLSLKKPVKSSAVQNKTAATNTNNTKKAVVVPTKNIGYQFTTTNWDDGWVSNTKEDWVEVTKDKTKLLLHYPNKQADAYNSVLKDGDMNAWNILVASRYNSINNFEYKSIQSWEPICFIEADAVEISTGKRVHIVLFKKHYSAGNGRYMEFITQSKAAFEQEFMTYTEESNYGSGTREITRKPNYDKLIPMQFRNKFSIAANDLVGKWSTNSYASLSYYYVNGGGHAGTTATSTINEFTFLTTTNYQSEHNGASGMVGNQRFSQQVYKGKFTVTNWNLELSNRFQGQSEKYDCYFEAVKGGRILMMTDRQNTTHSLVKQ